MARLFTPPPGASYPATVADMRKCQAGNVGKARMVAPRDQKPMPAPYPEIISSWLANGWTEADEGGEK